MAFHAVNVVLMDKRDRLATDQTLECRHKTSERQIGGASPQFLRQ
jgi:hypothetical protein